MAKRSLLSTIDLPEPVVPGTSVPLFGWSGAAIPNLDQHVLGVWMTRDTWAHMAEGQWLPYNPELTAYLASFPDRAVDIGVPLIPHEMAGGSNYNALLDEAIAGTHDAQYGAMGAKLAQLSPATCYARVWWEFNMSPDPAGTTDRAKFVAAWNRAVPLIRAGFAGAAKPGQVLKIVWCPISDGAAYDAYWPASANVDLVSMDPYGAKWSTTVPSAADLLAWVKAYLDGIASFAASKEKPLSLGEFGNWQQGPNDGLAGSRGRGDFPEYIDLIFDWIEKNPVEYVVYFNLAEGGVGTTLADQPNSLARLRTRANALRGKKAIVAGADGKVPSWALPASSSGGGSSTAAKHRRKYGTYGVSAAFPTYASTPIALNASSGSNPNLGVDVTNRITVLVSDAYLIDASGWLAGGGAGARNLTVDVQDSAGVAQPSRGRQFGLTAPGRVGTAFKVDLLAGDTVGLTLFSEVSGVTVNSYAEGDTGLTITSLGTGPQGAKGDAGAAGTAGAAGAKGDTGAAGAKGDKGDTGAAGAAGAAGTSVTVDGVAQSTLPISSAGVKATELAVTGTPNSSKFLRGDDTWSDGPVGPKGDPGTPGATGAKGDTGATGAKGDTGTAGAAGAAGAKGDTGAAGAQGDPGTPGATGAKGDTGAAGAAGAKGDTGATGAAGAKGDTGAKGDKGDTGAQGAPGAASTANSAAVQNLKAQAFDPIVASNTLSVSTYMVVIKMHTSAAISSLSSVVLCRGDTQGAGLSGWYAAVYDSAGALLGQTADFASAFAGSSQPFAVPLLAPIAAIPAGTFYVAIKFGAASTQPNLIGPPVSQHWRMNAGLSFSAIAPSDAAAPRISESVNKWTGASAPATLGNLSAGIYLFPWCGVR